MLLEIATEEFAQKGYFHTNSSIVKRAGLTQPSFYLYFDAKVPFFRSLSTCFADGFLSLLPVAVWKQVLICHHCLNEKPQI
ncbi:hypothetical protein KIS4809_2141 [Bacillus sp. ZZV12-4809]|nr:hypothetical protein KIS4809_2141 [Bacillus sp. ZZV12-4809]